MRMRKRLRSRNGLAVKSQTTKLMGRTASERAPWVNFRERVSKERGPQSPLLVSKFSQRGEPDMTTLNRVGCSCGPGSACR
jgi:hypothetical protein